MAQEAIQLEITAAVNEFRWNQEQYVELLNGPIARDLVRRAIRVEALAKRNATGRPGPKVITGRLRGSITWRLGTSYLGPYVDIGTAVYYAPFVELGTSRAPEYPFLRPALEAARY